MDLNYKKIGNGKPLLVLHGLMGMLDNWLAPSKVLAEHFEVYLIDARNHGHSQHDEAFDYELMMEDLLDFVEEHHLTDFHLLGHSMGGKVGMKFAQNYPDFVDKLIVADIAPKAYPVHHQKILEGLNAVDFAAVKSRGEVDEILADYIDEESVRLFLGKNLYWKEKGKLAWRFNLEAITNNIDLVGEAIYDRIYEGETLFINGANSRYILESDREDILLAFPKAQFQTIQDAGHWLHAEKPDEFLNLVLDFLNE